MTLTYCDICAYAEVEASEEPCRSCIYPNWEPTKEPMRCDSCLYDNDRPADKCGNCMGSNFKKPSVCTECNREALFLMDSGNWLCKNCGFVCMCKDL